MELFTSIKELANSGYVFRITDNGGATLDRITVLFCDGDYLSLSETGQGVSMWGGELDPATMHQWVEEKRGVDLAIGDLRPELQAHILRRVNEAWHDCLVSIEKRCNGNTVAKSREHAFPNEGGHLCGGEGIYSAGNGFCVRLDGDDAADDRGPFLTAREVLIATLPDDYALSGPEYHSTVNVARWRSKTPGVKAKLERLQARIAKAA